MGCKSNCSVGALSACLVPLFHGQIAEFVEVGWFVFVCGSPVKHMLSLLVSTLRPVHSLQLNVLISALGLARLGTTERMGACI